ncbi:MULTISPECIES: hypothetical protein [unclassified Kitasatospora]|uniref:hypothetical protein n=1 Tax=unclassified Kitasatospora TaxID=2633591 RepID=UPI002E37C1D1|nr:hypothetical protein [Kitasatospora sp. NBC_01246]
MTADLRPLWQPFSEPSATVPVQTDRHHLQPVERAPFLEPAGVADHEEQFPEA